jgi:HD-like signal output (HDOD) protein
LFVVSILGQQTIKRVAAGLETGEGAGLSEIVQLIQQLSNNALETSVQELAELIGKDVVVTAKVIAAANTIGYNPSGIDVSTINQAIHVIGFNKIRQLAISLLLVENAERTLNPSEKREIAALALCSGLIAETVMTRHGSLSAEQAFICASLRSYGRLLMTSFMIDEYRRAQLMAVSGMNEDEAFNRVFGLTPLELGHHLLASAHLPGAILKSLRALPPDAIKLATQNPDIELLMLSDLSVRICELALRPDVSAAEFEQRAQVLTARTGRAFNLDMEGLLGVLREAGQQLNIFATTFGLNGISSNLGVRIQARATGEEPDEAAARLAARKAAAQAPAKPAANAGPAPALSAAPSTAAVPTSVDPVRVTNAPAAQAPVASPAPASTPPIDPLVALAALGTSAVAPEKKPDGPVSAEASFQTAFENGIDQLAGLMDQEPIDIRKIYLVALQAALRGFAASDGIIFLREHSKGPYAAFYGKGSLYDSVRGQGLFRDADRNVFGVCLQRMEDVLIYDAADAKIAPYLPPWIKTGKLASFVLLPITENRRPFAILLAGWPDKKTVGFSVAQIRQVRSMLKLVGTARRLSGS